MNICVLTLCFQLHGCFSLKEKRSRLRGLRDRFGRNSNIAVSESDWHDQKDRAQITFVGVGSDKSLVEASLAKIIDYCQGTVDAELSDHSLEWL